MTQEQQPQSPASADGAPVDSDANDAATSDGRTRKERVIHTRVSAVLERELKQLADSLRVPVSNVVRAILEDAVGKIDEVGRMAEGEIRSVADRLEKHRELLWGHRGGRVDPADTSRAPAERTAEPEPADGTVDPEPVGAPAPVDAARQSASAVLEAVVGFQPLLLARAEACAVCRQPLAAGTEAFVGIRDDGGPRVIVGRECLPISTE